MFKGCAPKIGTDNLDGSANALLEIVKISAKKRMKTFFWGLQR